MHIALFITVAHLNSGAFSRKCADLIAFVCKLITLIIDIVISYR